nr:MAG: nucleocapsid protein [Sanya peribunyavirus 1]UHM27509.1 MAG: nucleocapsid protein [Hangzhou paederus fuscipes nairovirus 1]
MEEDYIYKFTTYEEALSFYTDNIATQDDESYVPCPHVEVINPVPYRKDIAAAKTKSEKSAILNKYVQDGLKNAVPVPPALWLVSEVNLKKAIDFFSNNKDADFLYKSLDYFNKAGANCEWKNTEKFIQSYRNMCRQFRDYMDFGTNSMATLHDGVVKQFIVNPNNVIIVQDILQELKRRRDQNMSQGTRGSGCAHYGEYIKYLDDATAGLFQPQLKFRNKSKLGGYNEKGVFDDSIGQLLLSTAILKHKQRGLSSEVTKMLSSLPVELRQQVLLEIKLLEQNTGSTQGQGPYQQVAGIDSVVSSAFWIFCVGKVDNIQDFRSCAQILYRIGQSPKGRAKVERILSKCDIQSIKRLVSKFSKCTDIYLPPYVLTPSRLEEVYATYACVSPFFNDLLHEPCVTWKALLNLRHGETFWDFMGNYFILDQLVNPADDDILSSLHAFHQTILSKTSAFQNTHNVAGDAFAIVVNPAQP